MKRTPGQIVEGLGWISRTGSRTDLIGIGQDRVMTLVLLGFVDAPIQPCGFRGIKRSGRCVLNVALLPLPGAKPRGLRPARGAGTGV